LFLILQTSEGAAFTTFFATLRKDPVFTLILVNRRHPIFFYFGSFSKNTSIYNDIV